MIEKYKKQLSEKGSLVLRLKIRVGASETKFLGVLDDGTIKVDLKSVPEKGKANKELVYYLTKKFGTDSQNVKIISGQKSRNKLVKIKK